MYLRFADRDGCNGVSIDDGSECTSISADDCVLVLIMNGTMTSDQDYINTHFIDTSSKCSKFEDLVNRVHC